MAAGRIAQLARLGAGFDSYLASTVDRDGAGRRIRLRIEQRAERFLEVARRLVYAHPASPYRRLLAAAGCEYGDLETAVRRHGLESALEHLRAAGVYVTLEELKGRQPIVRGDLAIAADETSFDSPLMMGRGISGTTSGSRSPPSRVHYDWKGLTEEAENSLLLDAIHGSGRRRWRSGSRPRPGWRACATCCFPPSAVARRNAGSRIPPPGCGPASG